MNKQEDATKRCENFERLFDTVDADYVNLKSEKLKENLQNMSHIDDSFKADLGKLKEALGDGELFNEAKKLVESRKVSNNQLRRKAIIAQIKSGNLKEDYRKILIELGELKVVDLSENPELKDIGAELLSTKEELNSKLDLILERVEENRLKSIMLERNILEKLSDISWKQNILEEQTVGTWFKVKRFFRNLFI